MDVPFTELLAQAKAGRSEALQQIIETYSNDVLLAVRRKLPRRLRTHFDSMDFCQQVWSTVISGTEIDPNRFQHPSHLKAFLVGVATNKVYEEYRRRTRTQKYDLSREESLYVTYQGCELSIEIPSSDPTPSQEFLGNERLDLLTQGRTDREAEAIRLRAEGMTFEQIADRLNVNERTVRRVISQVRRRLESD